MGLSFFSRPWKNRTIKYVIYAPLYSDEYGGIMALYGLANTLNKIGAAALIWPWDEPGPLRDRVKARVLRQYENAKQVVRRILQLLGVPRYANLGRRATTAAAVNRRTRSSREPARSTRRPTYFELRNAVAVYPEIVDGNPLRAKHVVRWFLNKPGRITGTIDYGPGELYFYQQAIFDDPSLEGERGGELVIVTVLDDIYRQYNFGERSGTCYILRKGKHRAPDPSQLDGPVIDRMDHAEIARLFNECEYCISYDLHTLYSSYAAMCGCKSVVVPEPGVDRTEWQPREELTYGIAYGMDDVDRAEKTKSKVALVLKKYEDNNLASVESFHRRCEEFFFG